MALDILNTFGEADSSTVTITHEARHDLESLIYVIVWICILYPGPNMDPISTDKTCLSMWAGCKTAFDVTKLFSAKAGEVLKKIPLKQFTPYFRGLEPYVGRMYDALLASTMDPVANPLTHDILKDILLDAFFNVPEPEGVSPGERARRQLRVTVPAKRKTATLAPGDQVAQGQAKRSRQS